MTKQHHIKMGNFTIGNDLPFVVLAGPCAMESLDHAIDMAGEIKEITTKLGIGYIYKTSFDKANRTSINSPRGVGLEKAIDIFAAVKNEYNIPIVTDIHKDDQCDKLKDFVDILQIPAFLCRQTDLLIAAAKSGLVVNVKKGQFLAPWEMVNIVNKMREAGCHDVMLCERGTSFGYNTLISDMRSLPTMAKTNKPIVFDATHSVQQPGGQGATSGGQREFVPVLARAAISLGVAAVFIETHQDPDNAPSDGPNMVPLDQLESLLSTLQKFDKLAKENPIILP